jgi:hypothetical protein
MEYSISLLPTDVLNLLVMGYFDPLSIASLRACSKNTDAYRWVTPRQAEILDDRLILMLNDSYRNRLMKLMKEKASSSGMNEFSDTNSLYFKSGYFFRSILSREIRDIVGSDYIICYDFKFDENNGMNMIVSHRIWEYSPLVVSMLPDKYRIEWFDPVEDDRPITMTDEEKSFIRGVRPYVESVIRTLLYLVSMNEV